METNYILKKRPELAIPIPEHSKWNGFIDPWLKNNLDAAKKIIVKDWDMIFVVDGMEGSGKSCLAQQMAYYLDPTINLERITFKPKEFVNSIVKATKYKAIIFDEAYGGLSSRSAMSEVNKMLVSVLAEIRQKNLFVFIVVPSFFELDRYPAMWRARALIHTFTYGEMERGKFAFWGYDRKKLLYSEGKKFYSYKKPSPNFIGIFSNGYVVPEKEYREKKLLSLRLWAGQEEEPRRENQKKWKEQRDACIRFLYSTGMTAKKIAAICGLKEISIRKMLSPDEKKPNLLPPI